MNETRHVEWDQVGDLIAYLSHLAEATPGFEEATSKDKSTAHRIEASLNEQAWAYIDEDDGTSLAPEWYGKFTPYTLDAADWSFMERWFCDPRLGKWAMESIGVPTADERVG